MKKLMFLIVFCAMSIFGAFAQKTFSGKVIGPDGLGLPGVSVVEKANPVNGFATDLDGNWTLTVPDGNSILQFTAIGMKTIEIAAKDASNLTMENDAQVLDDVLVTGYSKATKRSFVGTAATVKASDITSKAASNISQALSGETPGVTVINTNGQPGSVASIYVRGIGSVNGSSAPLYVVDGAPYDGSITAINTNDIESITLLKDASSTSIYGSRGANGVIVIQTKQGKRGSLRVNASQSFGINTRFLPRYDVYTSPEKYVETVWQGLKQRGIDLGTDKVADPVKFANKSLFLAPGEEGLGFPAAYNMWNATAEELIDPATGRMRSGISRRYTPEDWADYAFQQSMRSETNFSISGGDKNSQYFASVGYLKDKGYAIGSDYQRFTTRLNLTSNPAKWLRTGLNLNYNLSKSIASGQSSYSSTNLFTWVDDIPPVFPLFLRDKDGNIVPDNILGGNQYDFGNNGRPYSPGSNAIAITMLDRDSSTYESNTLTGFANIRFSENLLLENRIQVTRDKNKSISLQNKYYGGEAKSGGSLGHVHAESSNMTGLNLLRYTKTFDQHDVEAFVAHEFTTSKSSRDYIYKRKLVFPYGEDLVNALEMSSPADGYTDELKLESYFGQVNYNYNNKYFVSATMRRDGSSRFEKNKWGNFYSVGAAWMVSSEDFMKQFSFIDELKLKLSYGTLGSQGGISYYVGQDLYDMIPVNGAPSYVFKTKGAPDLTWEKSSMFQVGVEFKALNSRLEGSIDFYNKITSDMLFEARVAPSNGYVILNVNDGKLLNRGVDFVLTGHLLQDKNYFLDLSLNGGYLHNELLEMPIDLSTGKRKHFDESLGGFIRSKGHSLYDHSRITFVGVDPQTGDELYQMLYVDKNGNNVFDKGDVAIRNKVGDLFEHPEYKEFLKETTTTNSSKATLDYVGKSSLPFLRGGFNIKGGAYGFTLSLQFAYALGGYGYDAVYAGYMSNQELGKGNFHKDMEKRWMQPGDKTNIPKYNASYSKTDEKNEYNSVVRGGSTRFLTSSSFLALNNIRLGYELPKNMLNKLNLEKCTVWVSGDNVALLSARKGYNPTTSLSGGTSSYTYNPLTTFSVGVNLSF